MSWPTKESLMMAARFMLDELEPKPRRGPHAQERLAALLDLARADERAKVEKEIEEWLEEYAANVGAGEYRKADPNLFGASNESMVDDTAARKIARAVAIGEYRKGRT